jgi:vacuolar-type H+-ATPase subunit H
MAGHDRKRARSHVVTEVATDGSLVPELENEESRLRQALNDARTEADRRVEQAQSDADERLEKARSEIDEEVAVERERLTREIREELGHRGHSEEERVASLEERARSRVPEAVEMIVETVLGSQGDTA